MRIHEAECAFDEKVNDEKGHETNQRDCVCIDNMMGRRTGGSKKGKKAREVYGKAVREVPN